MGGTRKRAKLLGVGVGAAGLLGALALALRYAVRPPTKSGVPDAISAPLFIRRAVHTSIGQVVYHESGSGDPIVFVHGVGIGASSYEWSKVYPAFASRYRVLAPDLVGFGESERPNANLREEDYVRMLVEFIRATCWEQRPVLVGSGLGGGFCAYLASQHPEVAARLVLLNPTGLSDFGKQRLPLLVKLRSRLPLLSRFLYLNHQSTRRAVHAWLLNFGFANPARLPEETVDVFTKCAQQFGAQHAIRNFHAGRFNFDLETRIEALSQPLSLLWGERTHFPPMEWASQLQAIRPCPLKILDGVGTLAALEDPPQVIAALEDLLERGLRVYKAG